MSSRVGLISLDLQYISNKFCKTFFFIPVKALWYTKRDITINCGKYWKRWEYQTTWPASWETYMQVMKQQLELNMEQQTGAK